MVDKEEESGQPRPRTFSLSAVSLLPSSTLATGGSLDPVGQAANGADSMAEDAMCLGDEGLALEEELAGRDMLEKLIQEAGTGKFFVNCEQVRDHDG